MTGNDDASWPERRPVAQEGVRVRPLRTGSIRVAPGWFFRADAKNLLRALGIGVPADAWIESPVGAFLIEHPTAGPVLVDTGFHPVVASNSVKNLGVVNGTFFKGLKLEQDETAPAQLRALGIAPGDVRHVVMTHLHGDHTSAMSEFPNATFVTTYAEWKAARGPLGAWSGYVRGHLPALSSVRFVDFMDAGPWEGLSRTIDLLGDGAIRLVSTPGHTIDHLSVLVESDAGPVFLLGDAAYTLRNINDDVVPWRTASDESYRGTLAELRRFAAAHPETPLIPTHDPEVWDRIAPLIAP